MRPPAIGSTVLRTWLVGLCAGLLLAGAAPALSPRGAAVALAVLFSAAGALLAAALAPLLAPALVSVLARVFVPLFVPVIVPSLARPLAVSPSRPPRSTRPRLCLFAAGAALGLALGVVHATGLAERRLPLECVGEPLTVTGAIEGLPEVGSLDDGTRRTRFRFAADRVLPARCGGPERLLLTYYGDAELAPGQRWCWDVRLRRPWSPGNFGLADRRAWYAAAGIDAQGSVRGHPRPERLAPSRSLSEHIHAARAHVAGLVQRLPLERDTRAVLRALAVGDRSGLDARLWRTFQAWGIAHLLVISGLHIGLAAAFGYGVARLLLLLAPTVGAQAPVLAGLLFATLYSALAGFTVPVQRSLLMLAAFSLAALLGRRSGAWNNLLLAAVLVLLLNPLAGISMGFWLSFAAVAVLLWLGTWHTRRGFRAPVYAHVAMGFCMLPLGAFFFQGASLVAPLANLVLVPLVGLWVVPCALLAVLVLPLWPQLAALCWALAGWPLERVLAIMHHTQELAGASFYLHGTAGIAALGLGLAGMALLLVPGGWRHRLLGLAAVLCCAVPRVDRAGEAPGGLRITMLDVGQGTSVLVQQGDRALLYDTGGGDPRGQNAARSVVLPVLRLRGIRRLDTLVVSHGDRDHAAGSAAVLEALPVARLRWGPLVNLPTGRACAAGEAWRWPGGARFRFLSPPEHFAGASNDSSCVLQVAFGDRTVLLTGDIERAQERDLAAYWREQLAARWLLAPHHGSNTSSSHGFLKHVRPGHLLVGNGYVNRFGHPHPGVTARAAAHGAVLHETARRGAITLTLRADGREEWQFYRDLYRPHWAQPLHRALDRGL